MAGIFTHRMSGMLCLWHGKHATPTASQACTLCWTLSSARCQLAPHWHAGQLMCQARHAHASHCRSCLPQMSSKNRFERPPNLFQHLSAGRYASSSSPKAACRSSREFAKPCLLRLLAITLCLPLQSKTSTSAILQGCAADPKACTQ